MQGKTTLLKQTSNVLTCTIVPGRECMLFLPSIATKSYVSGGISSSSSVFDMHSKRFDLVHELRDASHDKAGGYDEYS